MKDKGTGDLGSDRKRDEKPDLMTERKANRK
jgi:hypothetical protein